MASPSQLSERLLFIEPFLAWRAWKLLVLDDGPRLGSVIYDYTWLPGDSVKARCMKIGTTGTSPHDSPDETCACGIYGSTDVEHIRHYVQETRKTNPHAPPTLAPSESRVFGLVALWGTVIECHQGFRAGFAYPKHLYLPCPLHDYAPDLEVYGVPVECVDEEHGFEALLKIVRRVRAQETRDD